MRRLYPPFLRGLPGVGLLILRLALSVSLLASALAGLNGLSHFQAAVRISEAVIAALFVVGLWTPVAGILVGLLQVCILLTATAAPDLLFFRAAVGLSLAFIGPGIWSVDDRLYGRRIVEIKSLDHS